MELSTSMPSSYDFCSKFSNFDFLAVPTFVSSCAELKLPSHLQSESSCAQEHHGLTQEWLFALEPPKLTFVMCRSCGTYKFLWIDGQWRSIESMLFTTDMSKTGFFQGTTPADRIVAFILSQICFSQSEIEEEKEESPLGPHGRDDVVKLIWQNGTAVGFFSVKLPGTRCVSTPYQLKMPMVDTVYVRKPFRGLGWGQQILHDVTSTFPSQNIGFSDPLSQGFCKVLEKFLTHHVAYRDLFWICSCDGGEGNRESVWLSIQLNQLNS